ncbi:hypothetical protein PN456_10665 [Nodularia spumigena CS-586/05]|uniref:Lipoprotein n=1 Tax=Nodularia spumigena CENA596 TaxID=1819295 RepID=A0A166K5E8_NODSP|nr:hypothetical protein [Nodularia spumigena]KZL50592.1 hypothetical protein A2T98_06910 [Nodularia spumigena CENA596]MDB9320601.1 hypothetical protein [Nodularia spumigena CS-591/07A]MDB9332426.1 hypothetical protein [Nodularia spumigena CS-591/04]MDB9345982.1 hypothetical protein [Nodularia spumigena CS-588/06]MDB9359052.1 hypothetical protein [Nodularia spumigena CS-588/02]
MKQRIGKILALAFLITAILSCSNNQTKNDISQQNIPPTAVTTTNLDNQTEKIKFKTEFGAELFSLKQQDNGVKLVDANDQELARIRENTPGKFKIKNVSEEVLGYVVREKSLWKLENPDESQGLYILKRQNDSHYTLEDAANKAIYQIQGQNNSWEIKTPENSLVYQVRIKDGKTSLRNLSGNTVFSTISEISPIAFACFGLDVLTREQQAGLAYAVNLTGGE